MAHKKRRIRIIIILLIFFFYFFIAARPIPREIVLSYNWISSLNDSSSSSQTALGDFSGGSPQAAQGKSVPAELKGELLPFTLGARFGYADGTGQFALNKVKTNDIYLSPHLWSEYSPEPVDLIINNIIDNSEIKIQNARGYPVLLDNRIFVFGSEQNSISEIDEYGKTKWIYEFGAPLTCMDAASGLVLTGSLDGVVEVFNSDGERIFYFEPGGSLYSVILGAALSKTGSHIGIVCGIEQQRFLLFERFGSAGGEYKIAYHEFIGDGFRRPVRVQFIDEDARVIFERAGGIGCYTIKSRRTIIIPLDGSIAAVDDSGRDGLLFLITSHPYQNNRLVGIKFPQEKFFAFSGGRSEDTIFLKAPFKSENVFLGRSADGSVVVAGGGTTLISFNLEEK